MHYASTAIKYCPSTWGQHCRYSRFRRHHNLLLITTYLSSFCPSWNHTSGLSFTLAQAVEGESSCIISIKTLLLLDSHWCVHTACPRFILRAGSRQGPGSQLRCCNCSCCLLALLLQLHITLCVCQGQHQRQADHTGTNHGREVTIPAIVHLGDMTMKRPAADTMKTSVSIYIVQHVHNKPGSYVVSHQLVQGLQ